MSLDVLISIICTNNKSALGQCLDTLPAACSGLDWEAVVVDNASADGTAEMVRANYSWARLIVNDARQGFSANHNQVLIPAVREARARYLLILNDDVLLDAGSISALVAAAEADSTIGAAGPEIRGLDGTKQQSFFPWPSVVGETALALCFPRSQDVPPRGWLNGSCILFRSEALERVGALDERFFLFFEDTDICLRLCEQGWRVALVEASKIVHLEHQTVSRPVPGSPMAKQMLRSRDLYFRKHEGRVKAALVTVLTRGALALRAVKALIVGGVTHDPEERATARLMRELIAYSPGDPLDHELKANSRNGQRGTDQAMQVIGTAPAHHLPDPD